MNSIPTIKNRGNTLIWLALFVFFLLMPCSAQAVKVEVQPGSATGWRGSSTSIVVAVVIGGRGGSVWGSGPYTDDSSISTAAVHSGALADGETGLVKIAILPGQSSYASSTSNGVTTTAYGNWYGSYSISRWNYDGTTIDDPINFASWGNMRGTFNVSLTGVSNGRIWGTDTYTSDSLLATAAVHAGKLTVGQSAVVPVTLLDGISSYTGSTRNGVSSSSYGSYGSSYSFGTKPTPTPTSTKDADIIINYVEDLNLGEPVFVPKRQQTTCSNGVCYRIYNKYYGIDLLLGTYNNEFYLVMGKDLYDLGSVAEWLTIASGANVAGLWKMEGHQNIFPEFPWKADLTLYADGTMYYLETYGAGTGATRTGTWSVTGNSFSMEYIAPNVGLVKWIGTLNSSMQNISNGTYTTPQAGADYGGTWAASKQP